MAVCLRPQVIWVPFTNSTTPRNQITVYIPDAGRPIADCSFLLVQESDYKNEHLTIDNSADALAIASAFVLLVATLGLFKYLIKSVWDVSPPSDEKH